MWMVKKIWVPVCIGALLVGCGDKKSDTEAKAPTQVAAKVNGTELTVHQVNYVLQRIPNLDKAQTKAASLRVARNLVEQEALMQKAVDEKLDRDPVVVQALDAARRQILAEAYMGRKLGTPTEPSATEVSNFYEAHPELFAKRKVYRLQEISIKAPKDKHPAIRDQLTKSKSLNNFAAWLKAENLPAKAAQGVKPAEQLPQAILPKLAEMPDGQAMVVNAPDGLLVVILASSQLQPVTLEQAKPVIARLLQTQARQKAAKAQIDAVKQAAKIEYLGEFVDAGKEEATLAAADVPKTTPAAPKTVPAGQQKTIPDADAISKGMSGLN